MFPQISDVFATDYFEPEPFNFLRFFSAFFFIFILINLAIIVYLFIDARKHNRNSLLWPLLAFFCAWIFGIGSIIILFIYLATRGEGEIELKEEEGILGQGIKRGYFYIFSFIALGILFFGLADLIRVILDYNWAGPATDTYGRIYSYTRDSFTKNVSFRLAAIIVSLPIWFFHWFHLDSNLAKITDPQELKITFRTHKAYLYLVSGLSLGVVIIFGIWFVYQILNLLLGVSNIRLGSFAAPLGYTATALATLAYHFSIIRAGQFKEVEQKVSSLPTAPKPTEQKAVEVKTATKEKFCPKCGIKNSPTNSFCTSCGTKLT